MRRFYGTMKTDTEANPPDTLQSLTAEVLAFRDARDWAQFHTPDHLAKSISVEAGELLECYLWKTPDQVQTPQVAHELADILYATLLLAHTHQIDLPAALRQKLTLNAEKYPIDKAKGSNVKWDEL